MEIFQLMSEEYNGKVLKVNLSTKQINSEIIDEITYRRYLGGSALASYFLLNELKPGVDPLGEENILVFTCSVITGIPVPGASRYTIASKSPLTGGFGESEAGGWWGPQLKRTGFDALIIYGCSEKPVYLWINDGKAEILSALHLYGKDVGTVEKLIHEELGDKEISILQIGPAGEKLVRYSIVSNHFKHVNGRTGMGAVMGSKNLRAIAVRGKRQVKMHNKQEIIKIGKWFNSNWKNYPAHEVMHEHGTGSVIESLNNLGLLPTHNFKSGYFNGAKKIAGTRITKKYLIKREGCYACPIQCKRIVKANKNYLVDSHYGGPEYETIASIGSLCEIDDIEAIFKGNELCNRLGLDTISTGVSIAFAMECFEKGIINQKDTGGLKIEFGDTQIMLELINMIGRRQGIGNILAEGVKRAARKFGKGSEKYAMHVKGQEMPLHEPRGKPGVGLGYALSPTGADHLEAPHDPAFSIEGQPLKNASLLGILEPVETMDLGERKVRLFSYLQKVFSLYNTIGMCNFIGGPIYMLSLDKIVQLVSNVTGWQTSLWELLKVGEKANTMARCFNYREGFKAEDDTLPDRFFTEMTSGPNQLPAINKFEFKKAVKLYYGMQGWDDNGIPTKSKLSELELGWIKLKKR